MRQVLLAQEGVPFLPGHARPHAPQLAASSESLTSQPLPARLSQSAKPALQAIWQRPPAQLGVPPAAEQAASQAPQ